VTSAVNESASSGTQSRLGALVCLTTLVALGIHSALANADDAPQSAATSAPRVTPPTAIEALGALRTEMRRARDSADWPAYLAAAQRQAELLNHSPMSHLELARAQAHLKDVNAGLNELRVFAHMAQESELLDTLPDLAPLREAPAFKAIRQRAIENGRPIARSSLAFRLKDPALLPEDIEYDAGTKRFFISSILQKKIVTATMQGDLTDFATAPEGWPVLALKIDHARQLLWATEVAVEGFESVEAAAQGRSALLCYELRSGKLVRRIEGPRPTALGDLALTSDGTVIASDGQHGGIYRVRHGEDHLERIDSGDFISPQTVAVAADGAHLIVPDYLRGLGLLAPDTKRVTWLPTGSRHALEGIDGLYRAGNRLLAVQNGAHPGRVVFFSLDVKGTSVAAEHILERSTPTLGDPTHGVIVDDTFYYLANSGWNVLDDRGKLKPGMTFTEARVMKAGL
jgi:sugar lactone lactonase YvrE